MISIDFENVLNEDQDDSATHFFIDHLRKCFVASDAECFCEHIILPELEVLNKTRNEVEDLASNTYMNRSFCDENEMWRLRLSHYLNTKSHDYLNNLGKKDVNAEAKHIILSH
jgi:hypothetical protein